MYNRENIDPRFIGLNVHHRSVRMLKTQQWYQSLDLFSYILDAITEKSKLYCCLDNGLVEFTHGIDESKVKCNQLVELVHAVDELDPLTGYLRV